MKIRYRHQTRTDGPYVEAMLSIVITLPCGRELHGAIYCREPVHQTERKHIAQSLRRMRDKLRSNYHDYISIGDGRSAGDSRQSHA